MSLPPDRIMLRWIREALDKEAHRPRGGGRDGLRTVVDRRPVGEDCTTAPSVATPQGWARSSLARQSRLLRGDPVGAAHRRPLEGAARGVPESRDVRAPIAPLGGRRHVAEALAGVPRRARWTPPPELQSARARPPDRRGG